MYSIMEWVLVVYDCLRKGEGVGGETNAIFMSAWKICCNLITISCYVAVWFSSLDFQHPTKKLQCVYFSQFQGRYHRYSKLVWEAWVTWRLPSFYPRTVKVLDDIIYSGFQNYLRPGMFWLESAAPKWRLISCLFHLNTIFMEGSFNMVRWIVWSNWFCIHFFRLPMLLVLSSCGFHPSWLLLKHIFLL